MSDVAKLTEDVERLTTICDQLLTLIQHNHIAAGRPPADDYDRRWSDTKERIEELQISQRD